MIATGSTQFLSSLLRPLLVTLLVLGLAPASSPLGPADAAARDVPGATLQATAITPFGGARRVTDLHVFVAVGQSNMSGHGHPIGGTRDSADPRILQFGANVRTLRLATVPLDMQRVTAGLSPATTMAREYLKYQPPNVGVLIIPAARGATAFTQFPTFTWSVGAASRPAYDLPALAVKQTRQGLQAARSAGYTVELKGILWHQGEGNPNMSTSKYSAELDRLIAFFRVSFASPRLPFVVGRMAPEAIAAMPGLTNIDRAHKETPDRVAYTGFAPSRAGGVNPGDGIHFSRIGVEYLGKAYVVAYRQAVANAPKAMSARH